MVYLILHSLMFDDIFAGSIRVNIFVDLRESLGICSGCFMTIRW